MKRMRKALLLAAIALLSTVAGWFVVGCNGMFVIPVQGPEWRVCLRSIHENLAEGVQQYADDHGGRFPDDLRVLTDRYIPAMADPVAARRLYRAHVVIAWAVTASAAFSAALFVLLDFRSMRYRIALVACSLGCYVCLAPRQPWFPRARNYDYLDRFQAVPGLRRPLPDLVPVIWARRPYALYKHLRVCHVKISSRWRWVSGSQCLLDAERLFELLATARGDRATLVASAKRGDLNALLVLATTPELRAGDVFVGSPNGDYARAIALMGLHNLDDPRTAAQARKALASRGLTLPQYAVQLLGHRRAPGTTEVLAPLLRDKDRDVRSAAIAALGCDGDPRAIGLLRSMLRKYRSAEEPLLALGRMRTKEAVAALCDEMGRRPDYFREMIVTKALPLAGELAVPALASLIPDASGHEVCEIIDALGSTRSEAAIEPLVGLVKRKPRRVGLALARIGARGGRTLVDLAQTMNYEKRLCAAAGLGHTRHPETVEALISLMSYSSVVDIEVARSLGRRKDPRAVDALIEALSSSDSPLRQAAARSLLSLRAVRAIPAVRRAAKTAPKGTGDRQLMERVVRGLKVHQRYLESRDRQDGGDPSS